MTTVAEAHRLYAISDRSRLAWVTMLALLDQIRSTTPNPAQEAPAMSRKTAARRSNIERTDRITAAQTFVDGFDHDGAAIPAAAAAVICENPFTRRFAVRV